VVDIETRSSFACPIGGDKNIRQESSGRKVYNGLAERNKKTTKGTREWGDNSLRPRGEVGEKRHERIAKKRTRRPSTERRCLGEEVGKS